MQYGWSKLKTVEAPLPDSGEVSFESDLIEGMVPLNVQLTNTSTYGEVAAATFLWDFGDGNTSTDENPAHEYDIGGSYTVSLTVTYQSVDKTHTIQDFINVFHWLDPNSMWVLQNKETGYALNVYSFDQSRWLHTNITLAEDVMNHFDPTEFVNSATGAVKVINVDNGTIDEYLLSSPFARFDDKEFLMTDDYISNATLANASPIVNFGTVITNPEDVIQMSSDSAGSRNVFLLMKDGETAAKLITLYYDALPGTITITSTINLADVPICMTDGMFISSDTTIHCKIWVVCKNNIYRIDYEDSTTANLDYEYPMVVLPSLGSTTATSVTLGKAVTNFARQTDAEFTVNTIPIISDGQSGGYVDLDTGVFTGIQNNITHGIRVGLGSLFGKTIFVNPWSIIVYDSLLDESALANPLVVDILNYESETVREIGVYYHQLQQ